MSQTKLAEVKDRDLDRIVDSVVDGRTVLIDPETAEMFRADDRSSVPHYCKDLPAVEEAIRLLIADGRLKSRSGWPILRSRSNYRGTIESVVYLVQDNAAARRPTSGLRSWAIVRNGNLARAVCELIVIYFWDSRTFDQPIDMSESASAPTIEPLPMNEGSSKK